MKPIFKTRREIYLFVWGILAGALIAALGFGLYANRAAVQEFLSPDVLPEYAAHSCEEAAPPPSNGAQAWMTNPRPPLGGMVRFCARLIQDGIRVNTAEFRPVMRYETVYGDVRETGFGTYAGGIGVLDTGILNITDARLDTPVDIEIQISPDASWKKVYTAYTTFMFTEDYLTYPSPGEIQFPYNSEFPLPAGPPPVPSAPPALRGYPAP